jgi:hypothetical protein
MPMSQQPVNQASRWIAASLLAVILSSCHTFEPQWRRSLAAPVAVGAEKNVGGAYEGEWHSVPTDHRGRLRCLIAAPSPVDAPDRHFTYRANWGAMSGTFKTVQPVTVTAGHVRSKGVWILPKWAGGRYEFELIGTPDQLEATYRSAVDHGTFSLHRVHP